MKIPVHNPSAMPIYVHGAMILPGETRHFDEQDVPTHLRPKPAESEDAPDESRYDPLAELLAGSIKDIVAAFPDLADEDLARLEDLENAEASPRKGLLAAIGEEKLKRAAADEASKAGGAGNEGSAGNEQGSEG